MNSNRKYLIAVLATLAGCATPPTEGLSAGVTTCSDPIPSGAQIVTCATGVSAATRQTVAGDRCIGGVLPRDTRLGSLNRVTLC